MCKIKICKNLIIAKLSKMVFVSCFVIFWGLISFSVCSCGKKNKTNNFIRVEHLDSICNLSFFRGIRPNMLYDDIVALVGEPNDYIYFTYEGVKYRDLVYYFKEGKIRCGSTFAESNIIDDIRYIPYQNIHLSLDEVIKCPIEKFGISSDKKLIYISAKKEKMRLTISKTKTKVRYLRLDW